MIKITILLIEPDVVLSRILISGLAAAGIIVRHCRTAQEAVTLADIEKFDLVICELLLTRHGGIEFLYEFRSYADWQNIPVIIFSSVPPAEFNRSRVGLTTGLSVKAYLYKPDTSLNQLIEIVKSVLAVPADGTA